MISNLMGVPTQASLTKSSHFRHKNAIITNFKLEILMYVLIHPPPNIGPLTPPYLLPFLY
jgi:hypothetical protein